MSDRIIEIHLPKLGESIVSATIVQWLKEEGDLVMQDEPILEVSTDKVNSEIPAPYTGVLTEKLVQENQEVDVGAPLAKLLIEKKEKVAVSASINANEPTSMGDEKNDFLSPAVLNLARKKGVALEALSKIEGSGQGGRVTKKDVEDFLEKPNLNNSQIKPEADIEKLPMCGLRKAIADNMVRSFYQAPHASLVSEVDVTEIMEFVKENKAKFLETHGVKLTITSYIVQAIAHAVKNYPMVNASVDKDTILMKRFVNLGIAVSIENGVVVPVIKNCHQKDIPTIAKEVARLSDRARNNQLNQEDVRDGTITMTNFGMSGMHIGIPIIRFPEVAIIGVGSIHKTVSPITDTTFGIRQKVFLTLTFDHRVIDGIYGANFLNHVKSNLESIVN